MAMGHHVKRARCRTRRRAIKRTTMGSMGEGDGGDGGEVDVEMGEDW